MEELNEIKSKIIELSPKYREAHRKLLEKYSDLKPEWEEGWHFTGEFKNFEHSSLAETIEEVVNSEDEEVNITFTDGKHYFSEWVWDTIENLNREKLIPDSEMPRLLLSYDVSEKCREFMRENESLFEDYEESLEIILLNTNYILDREECFYISDKEGEVVCSFFAFPDEGDLEDYNNNSPSLDEDEAEILEMVKEIYETLEDDTGNAFSPNLPNYKTDPTDKIIEKKVLEGYIENIIYRDEHNPYTSWSLDLSKFKGKRVRLTIEALE